MKIRPADRATVIQETTEIRKKRILLFTEWYAPGFKAGGPIQSCKNLVDLLKNEYSFYIYCSDRDLGDVEPYESIKLNQWIEINSNVNVWYASPASLGKSKLNDLFQTIKPDVVYFNSMYSLRFTLLPLQYLIRKKFIGKIILAPRGMLHKGAIRQKAFKKRTFILLFKFIGWHKKILFHATDEQEYQDVAYYFKSNAKIVVAANIPGVLSLKWKECKKIPGELKLIFISRIHPKKNLTYFINQLKMLGKDIIIYFDIYGSSDNEDYLLRCKNAVQSLSSHINIRFMGPLEHEILFETLANYHVFVLPTLGENYGHAIFEALSAGKPVLISDQTPWRKLQEAEVGWDISLREPYKFREAIETAASWNQLQYNEWSKAAFYFAQNRVDINDLRSKYCLLFG
jgi:glycosyltransferase involved in cell wall biosynthesis